MRRIIFFIFLALQTLFAACNADPNVISDEQPTPSGPGILLECDSLPAPNSIFSNAVGEVLVFTDSLGLQLDSLVCAENEAYEELVEAATGDFCEAHYSTAYSTKWQPVPDVYAVRFSYQIGNASPKYSAQSVPQEDFGAWTSEGQNNIFHMDSITINGVEYKQATVFPCQEFEPCAFVQTFVIANGVGLVAYQRQDKWWTKK